MNTLITKNVSNEKKWNWGTLKVHLDPPPITLIKSKNNDKPDENPVTIKLRRDTTSEKLYLYEFKMALFDNGDPEEFFLFISNFNMNLEASGMLKYGTNIQYL